MADKVIDSFCWRTVRLYDKDVIAWLFHITPRVVIDACAYMGADMKTAV